MDIHHPPAGVEDAAAGERRVRARELRAAGMSYRQIATTLQVPPAVAYADVQQALELTEGLPAESLIELENDRLDGLLRGVWAKALKGDLGAQDRALRIIVQQCKLNGLYTLDEEPADDLEDTEESPAAYLARVRQSAGNREAVVVRLARPEEGAEDDDDDDD